jgi:hypothetical protein
MKAVKGRLKRGNMIRRQLRINGIESLCNGYEVDDKAVEKFLMDIGGVSLEAAYNNLRYCRKLHRWNIRTTGAISDGIIVATTDHMKG